MLLSHVNVDPESAAFITVMSPVLDEFANAHEISADKDVEICDCANVDPESTAFMTPMLPLLDELTKAHEKTVDDDVEIGKFEKEEFANVELEN